LVKKIEEESAMPRGDKGAYTDKQKRKAEHIEEGYEKQGVSEKEAAARAWATVNKESGGGKKSGSGRGKKENRSASKKGGKKGGKKSAKKSSKKAGKKSAKKSSKKSSKK
jgi:plasmid stabilization system protein ParE